MTDEQALDREKQCLRRAFRQKRRGLPPAQKAEWDGAIAQSLLAHEAYRDCQTLLVYSPLVGEIDTRPLIEAAWAAGKTVAAPRCVPDTRDMKFYRFGAWAELQSGSYGIQEPAAQEGNHITDFAHALCIVPGFSFDEEGYRLGYGGGYYDRFLAQHPQAATVGLCYRDFLAADLPRGAFDKACDFVVTEEGRA